MVLLMPPSTVCQDSSVSFCVLHLLVHVRASQLNKLLELFVPHGDATLNRKSLWSEPNQYILPDWTRCFFHHHPKILISTSSQFPWISFCMNWGKDAVVLECNTVSQRSHFVPRAWDLLRTESTSRSESQEGRCVWISRRISSALQVSDLRGDHYRIQEKQS